MGEKCPYCGAIDPRLLRKDRAITCGACAEVLGYSSEKARDTLEQVDQASLYEFDRGDA